MFTSKHLNQSITKQTSENKTLCLSALLLIEILSHVTKSKVTNCQKQNSELHISLVFHLLKNLLVCSWHFKKRHKKESRCFWEVQSSSNFLSQSLCSARQQTLQRERQTEKRSHITHLFLSELSTQAPAVVNEKTTAPHFHNLHHARPMRTRPDGASSQSHDLQDSQTPSSITFRHTQNMWGVYETIWHVSVRHLWKWIFIYSLQR